MVTTVDLSGNGLGVKTVRKSPTILTTRDFIDPQRLGLSDETDFSRLYRAASLSISEGLNVKISRPYVIDRCFIPPSGAKIEGINDDARITNNYGTGYDGSDTGWNNRKATLGFANLHPAYNDDYTYYAVGAIVSGQRELDCLVEATYNQFNVGDRILIAEGTIALFSRDTVDDNNTYPIKGGYNYITAKGHGNIVTLAFPVGCDFANPYIANPETAGIIDNVFASDTSGGMPLFVAVDTIIEGLHIESVWGNALQRGGMVNCRGHFRSLTGRYGLSSNGACYSDLRADLVNVTRRVSEVAMNSMSSNFHITKAVFTESEASTSSSLIKQGEGSVNTTTVIDDLIGTMDPAGTSILIRQDAVTDCGIEINRGSFSGKIATAIQIINTEKDLAFSGQVVTIRPRILINRLDIEDCTNPLKMSDAGGELDGAYVEAYMYGTATANCDIEGTNNTIKGRFFNRKLDETKAGTRSKTPDNNKIDVTNNYARNTYYNEALDGAAGAASVAYDKEKSPICYKVISNATSITVPLPTGFFNGDIVTYTLKNSTGSAKTPSFNAGFIFDGTVVASIDNGKISTFIFVTTANNKYFLVSAVQNQTE